MQSQQQMPHAQAPTHQCSCCPHGLVLPQVSQRVVVTDPPVIVKTKQLMAKAPASKQVMSLAQGIVHWQPPPAAMQAAGELLAAGEASINGYGPAEGLPALREALQQKVADRNGLPGVRPMQRQSYALHPGLGWYDPLL